MDFGGFTVTYAPSARQDYSFVELTVLGPNGNTSHKEVGMSRKMRVAHIAADQRLEQVV